jgi:hypothetical protein
LRLKVSPIGAPYTDSPSLQRLEIVRRLLAGERVTAGGLASSSKTRA